MEGLIARLRRMGGLFFIGFILIVYIALGFLYLQQGAQQGELGDQINKLSLVIAKPLPSKEELQTKYDKVNRALAPISAKDAVATIVDIAKNSGIDVDPENEKLRILPATVSIKKIGTVDYQLLSFKTISVQGSYNNVMSFISDLDSGATLKTLVLKRVSIGEVEIQDEDKKETRTETTATVEVDIYTKPQEK